MKTTHRRIALLTGASVAALSAAPAFAAPHEVAGTGTFAGTNTTAATVTICDIAGADPSCFFGVYNTGAATVAVAVNTAANGQIFQHDNGGDVTLTLVNATGDSAEVGAIAVATANADARLDFPVRQTGTGSAVSLYMENDGALLVDGIAIATGGAATADADATVYGGINQYAHTATSAHVSLVNNGTVTIAATAVATATNFASASAAVEYGIAQTANATGPASAALVNNGALSIAANATAVAEDASAYAYIFDAGIGQYVDGSVATASLTNATSAVIDMGAHASAVGTTYASASASISDGIEQYVTGSTSALGSVVNLGALNMHATAVASATSGEASAYAYIDSAINQNVSATGAAVGLVTNSATMNVSASASAVASTFGSASASISDVVAQNVNGGTFAEAAFANSGAVNVAAHAAVSAGTEGLAYAYIFDVVTQNVTAGVGGTAVASVVNSGTMAMTASATALAGTYASASAEIWGAIRQDVNGGAVAVANVTNAGAITLNAAALASGTSAYADASAGSAITQQALATGGGTASALAVNSGTISMNASAVAVGTLTGSASAFAEAYGAVTQSANAAGGIANVSLANSGAIAEHAFASASAGSSASASAYAYTALYQFATGATVNAVLSNSGTITNIATAVAVAGNDAVVDTATAEASAYGIGQHLHGGTVSAVLTNSGSVDVEAFASATAQENASADAYVTAVYQTLHGGTANIASFTNSGAITAVAGAHAIVTSTGPFVTATADMATATAFGYAAYGNNVGTSLVAVNSGTVVASASAVGGSAFASAVGMGASGIGGTVSMSNAGAITAVASASGVTSSAATAVGMGVINTVGSVSLTNSGSISVDAITAGGATPANALGIYVNNTGTDTTVTNAGDLIVRNSNDGGATWTRGLAIDVTDSVTAAPNVVNLLGGNIYGNIDVNAGDEIDVATGTTYFDGVINPEFVPVGGFTTANLDTGIFGEGTLNIAGGGNLILADPQVTGDPTMYDGPAYAIVDTLNLAADGTLTFELEPLAGGDQAVGTYPQVYADTAVLDGTIVARLRPAAGLFADSYFWDNVIDANVRSGSPTCVLDSIYASSPLITGAFGGDICDLDANANVDLGIERVAFNALGGLTANQMAVASAIEDAYSVDLTGDYGALVAELFLLDEDHLVAAYDQLSGVEYPNYLHAVRNNTFAINSVVSDQIDCPTTLGSIAACATPTYRGRVWVSGAYNTVNVDSDANAIGYDADNWNVMVGGDYNFGLASVGAFAGYRNMKVDYPDAIVGSGIDSDGFQAGIYGGVDTGRFYARLIGSYSSLQGDSERRISIGSISAIAKGQPDVDVWSFYGEAGARFDLGSSWVTPYVALDYTSMHLKDFKETGGLGANLDFDAQTVDQTSGLIGLKWAGNLGGITPEAKIAYRHDFQDDLGVDTGFAGISAASFTKVEDYSEDSIVAGLNFTGHLGTNFTGRLGYQGRFNSDVSDHTIYGTLTYLFGSAPPPPPPPPVEAPPPPPAPPATQVCPDGTTILATESCPVPPPPPPPPPPAPERG